MKIKKIVIAGLLSAFALSLAACSSNTASDDSKEESNTNNETDNNNNQNDDNNQKDNEDTTPKTYTIKYVDYLNNEKSQTFEVGKKSVFEDLKSFTTVTDLAGYITGIDSSFYDANWAIMIYENGVSASTGVEGLVADEGDVFEFKHEDWKTIDYGYGASHDEYDALLDKAVYNYIYNRCIPTLKGLESTNTSNYWDEMAFYHMKQLASNDIENPIYDIDLFYDNTILSETFKNYCNNLDYDNLGASADSEYFKFYYGARLIDNFDFTTFKTKFANHISGYTGWSDYSEYNLPFQISVASTLGLESQFNDNVKTTTYRPNCSEFGPDGLSWFLTGYSVFNSITVEDMNSLSFDTLTNSYSKDVSLASMILPYAAANKDVRTLKDSTNRDLIQVLFDDYFNQETMKFTTEAAEGDYSSNQIYASLIAYKIYRDTNQAFNLFK